MSSDQDASVASDQEQLDDQLNEEDAGGLFGSGSEDEGSGYGLMSALLQLKLTSFSVPTAAVTNAANLMMKTLIPGTMKAEEIVWKMVQRGTAKEMSYTSIVPIFLLHQLDATRAQGRAMARYDTPEFFLMPILKTCNSSICYSFPISLV